MSNQCSPNQSVTPITAHYTGTGVWDNPLARGRDIAFCQHERLPRNANNSLVRTAARACGQILNGLFSYVLPDDGEITRFQFENVGTAIEGDGLRAVLVRIRTETTEEFQVRVHNGTNRLLN